MTTTEIATADETAAEVVTLHPDEARNLTDQIKANGDHLWELITQAYLSRAWASLDYASWDDYCDAEFGSDRLQLPREKRQEKVQSLRSSGLTIEAISSVTGASTSTVSRDAEGAAAPAISQDGKKPKGRPKGSKNKPKEQTNGQVKADAGAEADAQAEEALSVEFISVPALPDADPQEFKDTDHAVAAFGTPQLGASVAGGLVMSYHNGFETDTFTPEEARTQAACLLQAADRAEAA